MKKKQTVMYGVKDGDIWIHLYSNRRVVELICNKKDVKQLLVKEDEKGKYWAWWDMESDPNEFCFVWQAEILLNMCFPYGPEVEEERGKGKKMRVSVEMVKEKKNKKS
jgi:hypothetical protein